MRTNIRLKLDMSGQVVKFCDLHPFDTPAEQEVAAHMKSLVARAEALARQQRAGTVEARASTATKAKLRSDIWDDLLVLRGFAESAALRQPEIPLELQLPDRQVSHQAFLTAARVVVAKATTHRDLLLTYGMPETMLDRLGQVLDQYEGAVRRKFESVNAHVGASADLGEVTDQIMVALRSLDSMNDLRFRDNPELAAAWASARNVAWPNPEQPAATPVAGSIQPAA